MYHRTDEAIRGHVCSSFLALVLKQELEARMREAGIEAEWADVVRDLGRLSETMVELQGKQFAMRTQAQGAVPQIVRCVGASLPTVVRRCGGSAGQPVPIGRSSASKAGRDPIRTDLGGGVPPRKPYRAPSGHAAPCRTPDLTARAAARTGSGAMGPARDLFHPPAGCARPRLAAGFTREERGDEW